MQVPSSRIDTHIGVDVSGHTVDDSSTAQESTTQVNQQMKAALIDIRNVEQDGRIVSTMFEILPDKDVYPDYFKVITKPICLSMIKDNIENSVYPDWDAFEKDVLLMFENARVYNLPGSQVCLDADALEHAYQAHEYRLERTQRAEQQPAKKRLRTN